MLFFDTNYLLFVMLPALVISGIAQLYLRSTYGKWGKTMNRSGLNGREIAYRIMRFSGLNVRLEPVPGELGDHFDPRSHTVRMSPSVDGQPTVASMAIVAHELGHAQQYDDGSALIAARSFLVPALQFSPMLSYILIFAGLFIGLLQLAWLGIIVFSLSVVFTLLTLPIELDASRRGLKLLEQSGLLATEEDRTGARQVLTAAALTYVAAAITSVLTLLYYISLVQRRSD